MDRRIALGIERKLVERRGRKLHVADWFADTTIKIAEELEKEPVRLPIEKLLRTALSRALVIHFPDASETDLSGMFELLEVMLRVPRETREGVYC